MSLYSNVSVQQHLSHLQSFSSNVSLQKGRDRDTHILCVSLSLSLSLSVSLSLSLPSRLFVYPIPFVHKGKKINTHCLYLSLSLIRSIVFICVYTYIYQRTMMLPPKKMYKYIHLKNTILTNTIVLPPYFS